MLDAALLKYGIIDISFGSVIYACEVFQWDEFLNYWMQFIISIEESNSNSELKSLDTLFNKAIDLKNKVIKIIQTSKGVKEDIVSLRESLSHLSSIIQENIKVSLIHEGSILYNDFSKSIANDDSSMKVSSDYSHNEVTLRNNIIKLKRDISIKIMNNKHLKRIVRQFSNEFQNNLIGGRIQSVIGDKSGTSINSLFSKKESSLGPDFDSNIDILERIESNISSLIASYENTTVFDEKKPILNIPNITKHITNNPLMKEESKKDSIKDQLNFDIVRTHYLQNLTTLKNQNQNLFNYKASSDGKEFDSASIDTARFGSSRRKQNLLVKSYQSGSSTNSKPSCKKNFIKLKPKKSVTKLKKSACKK